MNGLNKEYYKKIEAVRKNAVNYGRDKDLKLNSEGNKLAKELIIARTKMAEAESKLMDYDNRQKVSRFVKGEGNKVKKEE